MNERRSTFIAWLVNGLACVYCAWLGFFLGRNVGDFAEPLAGFGGSVPATAGFLVQHGIWLYPTVFGALLLLLLAKEALLSDKRLTLILTFLGTILAQLIADWTSSRLIVPFFEILEKIG